MQLAPKSVVAGGTLPPESYHAIAAAQQHTRYCLGPAVVITSKHTAYPCASFVTHDAEGRNPIHECFFVPFESMKRRSTSQSRPLFQLCATSFLTSVSCNIRSPKVACRPLPCSAICATPTRTFCNEWLPHCDSNFRTRSAKRYR